MDEITKQSAQEYLAAKLTEEEQIYEAQQNQALAVARSINPNFSSATPSPARRPIPPA